MNSRHFPVRPADAPTFRVRQPLDIRENHDSKSYADAVLTGTISTRFAAAKSPAKADRVHCTTTLTVSSGLGAQGIPIPRWKRAIDLAACVAGLPLLGLCALVMLVLTKRLSPGPVLFRQERIGYMGRRFKIYKFRTMKMNADCSVHQNHCKDLIRTNAPMTKLDNRGDSRIIPFTWLLRASGLDELPQLINVLRGEMSLVGPRPCLPAEFEQYVSWQRQRCDALPGLTGLWQVSGKNRTTFEQMIRLDIRYARELSPWLDLKIIILTVPSLLGQIGESHRDRNASSRAHQRRRSNGILFMSTPQPSSNEENTTPYRPSPIDGVTEPAESLGYFEDLVEQLHLLRRSIPRAQLSSEISEPPVTESTPSNQQQTA